MSQALLMVMPPNVLGRQWTELLCEKSEMDVAKSLSLPYSLWPNGDRIYYSTLVWISGAGSQSAIICKSFLIVGMSCHSQLVY
uniref:Uncharacterized protein n=1 Tax=Arundo donax TaxID=35708 RepID=A0A0A9H273_ARUDO